jgi:hypothetical protein
MNKQNKFDRYLGLLAILLLIAVIVGVNFWVNKAKSSNGGICGTSNYKVTMTFQPVTNPPTVTCNDTEQWTYCTDSRHPKVFWTYFDADGNPQSAYWIQADNNSDFSSPLEEDTGWLSSAGTEYPTRGNFSWDTSYYWHIKVRDSGGAESGWSSSCSFKTPLHAYPSPDFSKYPDVPVAGESVQFVDNTTYYGGSYGKAWSWTFTDGNPATSTLANPKVTFSSLGTKAVGLIVTDSADYSCPCSKSVGIGLPSPKWREIKPW